MADLSDERKNIQVEETRFRYGVSESLLQKLGKAINFINNRQHSEKQWFVNGNYGIITLPFSGIDGLVHMQVNAEIIEAFMFVQYAGSSGLTEIDIKKASTPGGSFASIFSTTPKIYAAAGNWSWCRLGTAYANTVAPVLASPNLNANDVLRCDLLQAQSGANLNGCGLILHYRPR